MLFEKYLVWSGRLSQEDVKRSELFSHLRSIDSLIKDELPGWKFAMTAKDMTSIVLTRRKQGDVVARVFSVMFHLSGVQFQRKVGNLCRLGRRMCITEVSCVCGRMHGSRSRHSH